MKLALKNPNDVSCEPGNHLNVVILGEDSVMTAQACETLEWLGHNLSEEGRLIYWKWNFEGLVVAALREIASMEAAMADIIIIGVRRGRALPWSVYAWMERWLELRKARPGTLVAVLDKDVETSAASKVMLSQLKKLAALGQMDFFVK